MIITDRAASVNPFSQTFSKTLRISMIIAKEGHMPFTLSPQHRVSGTADTAARRWRRKTPYLRAREMAACGGRGLPPPGGGGKRGQGHQMVPLPPLDSPKPSFALTHRRCAAKRELRGLGSVRRADFGTLLCPEFPLRSSPRITVRGHPVQGGSVPLRKAPLRSRVCSWSTKRPCGPLAFRRATGGSRVLRKVRRVKRGQETMFGVLSPFVSAGRPRHPRPPKAAMHTLCHGEYPPSREGVSRLRRRTAVSAVPLTLC